METKDYFSYIVNDIHSTVVATVDNDNLPVTCAVDIMDFDENSLYFLTAKGKSFYSRLINNGVIAFTGLKGNDTMSCVAISVRGKVKEIGSEKLPELFKKNPYMNQIYPTKNSQSALTVFQIYEGTGEWFDLSKLPIERVSFSFGGAKKVFEGYFINEKCNACKECFPVCPQKCIDINTKPAVIEQAHCLHCGKCYEICPTKAIEKR